MNISGIYPAAGFYQNYVSPLAGGFETASVKPDAASAAENNTDTREADAGAEARRSTARARQTFGAYDYANQYRPEDNITTRTAANIRSNDVDRAISDMQRDNALHQYQYFVKEGGPNRAEDVSAVTLRGGEDFAL